MSNPTPALALALGAALLPLSAFGVAAGEDSATVTLRVGPAGFAVPSHFLVGNPSVWVVDPLLVPGVALLPGVAGCVLDVPDLDGNGAIDGGDVLNVAAGTGCISGWSAQQFDFGRFVTTVDDVEQAGSGLVTFWYLQVAHFGSPVGIDGLALGDGAEVDFLYCPFGAC